MNEFLKPKTEFKEIEKKTKFLDQVSPKHSSKGNKKSFSRESIIGLGEDSFRKNYYPELQEKIIVLEEINLRYKALLEAIPDVLIVSDTKGNLSPFGTRLKIFSPLMLRMLENNEITTLLKSCVERVMDTGNIVTDEFSLDSEGDLKFYQVRAHKTELDEILIIIQDMTTRILLENQLRQVAEMDGLTSIYNRYYFEKELLKYSSTEQEHIGFLLLDIDGLKIINDTLGHVAGDNLIKSSAFIISQVIAGNGMVARIGGDEFGVILENVNISDLEAYLDKIKIAVDLFNQENQAVSLSLSFGYAYHESGLPNTSLMYQEADNNMYQSKLLKSTSNKSYIVKSLMKALEARDYITEGHADRMGELAVKMGRVINLTSSQLDRIELLTKFHDLGKVGISDLILNKPSQLTEAEYKVMQTHSAIGERIANESGELKEISKLILQHHERFDGSGYPLGKKGQDIPIECRILSIVDTYDAMTNDRPYRRALPDEVAREELIKCSGTQFDPELVEVFINNC